MFGEPMKQDPVIKLLEAVAEVTDENYKQEPYEIYQEQVRALFMKDREKFCDRFFKGMEAIQKEMEHGHGRDGGVQDPS
jgi:hypothetical protein